MRSFGIFAATAALLVTAPALAQDVKVGIGISGWTGFAPLTLANQAGIFRKNGIDVTIKKIPQKDRHLAIASGDASARRPRSKPGYPGMPMVLQPSRYSSSTRATALMAWRRETMSLRSRT